MKDGRPRRKEEEGVEKTRSKEWKRGEREVGNREYELEGAGMGRGGGKRWTRVRWSLQRRLPS